MDGLAPTLPLTLAGRRGAILLGLLVVALLWAGVGYKGLSDWRTARNDATRTDESFALVFEENVLRAIGEIDKSLLYMRHSLEDRHGTGLYGSIATTKDLLSEIIVQVAIIDSKGIMRASNAGPQPPAPINLADRDHFKVHVGAKEDFLYISKPVLGRASGRMSVQFSRRFLTPEGDFGGVVVASLNPEYLTRFYDGMDFGTRASIALIGDDGTVRASGGTGFVLAGSVVNTPLGTLLKSGQNGTFTLPAYDNFGERMVTIRKVRDHPLRVVVSVLSKDIEDDTVTTLAINAAVAAVLTALVALAVAKLLRIETERSKAEAQVLRLALQDPLTELPNRRLFRTELGSLAADPPGKRYAVFLLDIDGFKFVNDTIGHSTGDGLLVEIGRRLSGVLSPGQMVARIGGDEFAVIVPSFTTRACLGELAGRLCKVVADPFEIERHHIRSTISIGVAIGPDDGANADDIMIAADLALYAAKAGARGSYVSYEPSMSENLLDRRRLEMDLRAAVAAGELRLEYQPSINLASGQIAGFEALARWRHPVRGDVPPSFFIGVAEACGLIHELGAWALTTACRQALDWPADIRLAVNLSPVQFAGPDLVAKVQSILALTKFPASRLELEITEQMLLDNGEQTVAIVRALKALGLSIAMDDFGTGYSSLNYLRDFPFDRIKVDRSFVSELGRGAQHTAIIRAVIDIARSLGMATTAEGVETLEQRDLTASLGCGEVQGYFYARPLPAAEVSRFIAQWQAVGQIAA